MNTRSYSTYPGPDVNEGKPAFRGGVSHVRVKVPGAAGGWGSREGQHNLLLLEYYSLVEYQLAVLPGCTAGMGRSVAPTSTVCIISAKASTTLVLVCILLA